MSKRKLKDILLEYFSNLECPKCKRKNTVIIDVNMTDLTSLNKCLECNHNFSGDYPIKDVDHQTEGLGF